MPMSYCIHRLHILARTDEGVFYMDVLSIRSNFVNLQELDKKKLILNKRRLELVGIEKCLQEDLIVMQFHVMFNRKSVLDRISMRPLSNSS